MCGDVVLVGVVVGVVVGHSFCKTSEVNSDHTLPVYIVKHDPLGPAKVVVGVSIALYALVRVLPGDLPTTCHVDPPRGPGSTSHT